MTLKLYTTEATLDIEDDDTRKIMGSLFLKFIGDEHVYVSGLRGKGVFKALSQSMVDHILAKYPKLRVAIIIMETSLFNKFEAESGLNITYKEDVTVSGKQAYLAHINLKSHGAI